MKSKQTHLIIGALLCAVTLLFYLDCSTCYAELDGMDLDENGDFNDDRDISAKKKDVDFSELENDPDFAEHFAHKKSKDSLVRKEIYDMSPSEKAMIADSRCRQPHPLDQGRSWGERGKRRYRTKGPTPEELAARLAVAAPLGPLVTGAVYFTGAKVSQLPSLIHKKGKKAYKKAKKWGEWFKNQF